MRPFYSTVGHITLDLETANARRSPHSEMHRRTYPSQRTSQHEFGRTPVLGGCTEIEKKAPLVIQS